MATENADLRVIWRTVPTVVGAAMIWIKSRDILDGWVRERASIRHGTASRKTLPNSLGNPDRTSLPVSSILLSAANHTHPRVLTCMGLGLWRECISPEDGKFLRRFIVSPSPSYRSASSTKNHSTFTFKGLSSTTMSG